LQSQYNEVNDVFLKTYIKLKPQGGGGFDGISHYKSSNYMKETTGGQQAEDMTQTYNSNVLSRRPSANPSQILKDFRSN
jgi:hypothetical protein